MTKIIGDPGSTHDGDLDKAKQLIKIGKESGLDAVKFQLLTQKETLNGNIGFPWEWMKELIPYGKELGIEVFASAFDEGGIKRLWEYGCKSIKFSHSQFGLLKQFLGHYFLQHRKRKPDIKFTYLYYSTDVMGNEPLFLQEPSRADKFISLYCIPEYPVPYIPNFDGLFPLPFHGFSSHCMGIEQDKKAIKAGAMYIEKHYQGTWYSPTPDGRFAIKPKQLEELCKKR